MKQIYYTQCPIGYGLGASNGFQIKRLSPGYPVSGDFRHLGLRAFVAGTRTLAPPTLRYRRGEDGVAEVAWLTPRSHEYETERGPWGRPGGHFAHGLRLDDDEMKALRDWPAGLYDQPFWTRTDREPSRGQPPEPRELTADALRRPPTFEQVAPLAAEEDAGRLAVLLTALAAAVRDGRTLFLIDEPARVADRIALLTFAFPPPWRKDLTFSTYHDRPEELPGFRLQGTIPAARPNRPALLAQGIVADFAAGTIEPAIEPASWARTLAGWLAGRSEADRADWEGTARRARRARRPSHPATIWEDAWLDRVFRLPALLRDDAPAPRDADEWLDLAEMATWAGRAGLAADWAEARGPSWWLGAFAGGDEPREALRRHVGLAETWRDGRAAGWGETVARWVEACDPGARQDVVAEALETAPEPARAAFVQALLKALPEPVARETLPWLTSRPACQSAVLLPMEARLAVGTPDVLRAVLQRATADPSVLRAVLDAVAEEAAGRVEARESVAEQLAELMATADPGTAAAVQQWALRQGDAADVWMGRYLRRFFVEPIDPDAWQTLRERTPPDLRPSLARVVLGVARERESPDAVFRRGVEELLLPIGEESRPHDPSWAGAYLDRTRSGLDLLTRLYTAEYRRLGVSRWIDEARRRGELSPEQIDRIKGCASYARALQSGNARALLEIELPAVPPEERGAMLAQILGRVGYGSADALDVALDTCREAWPGGFSPGASGLDGLAGPLADAILSDRADPVRWLGRLSAILGRLGLAATPGAGFEPDGLAAHVVAVTTRKEGTAFDPWRLRQSLLQNHGAWRALALDVGRDLQGRPVKESLATLERWDRLLAKGPHTDRFFELWLNVCDGSQLAAVVAARLADLRSFDLSWWASRRYLGARDDLRDAFARLAPIAPMPQERITALDAWLAPGRRVAKKSAPVEAGAVSSDLAPLEPQAPAPQATRVERDWSRVSDFGRTRWGCLEALAEFNCAGIMTLGRWRFLIDRAPRLDRLDADDRYRFVAWLILLLDDLDDVSIPRLARWLFATGVTDADRVKSRWPEELAGLTEVPQDFHPSRIKTVRDLWEELRSVGREAKDSGRKSG